MFRSGDTIENPVTGERLVFRATAAETNGEVTAFDTYVQPNGAVAAAHYHPLQSERFEIVSGRIGLRLGGEKLEVGPGQVVRIGPGTPHKFWNAGDAVLHFVAEVRPALRFEEMIRTMFGLAADGKTNAKGMPNPFRMAVIAAEYKDIIRLPFPPAAVQDLGLALGAPLGRLLGYQPVYEPAGAPAFGLGM
jgi:mannose-6-phosphate isomerase-like protein (cupin superfamily)